MRILISGYYGFGNIGDEAILAALVDHLRAAHPAARVCVLSADPAATAAAYAVEAAQRWSLPTVARQVLRADLLIQGGGGLLQDTTSARSVAYYLGILRLARLMRIPYAVFAQGIGPLQHPLLWRSARANLSRAASITLRDDESAAFLRDTLRIARPIAVAPDPALCLKPSGGGVAERLLADAGVPRAEGVPRIGIALRDWPGVEPAAGAAIALIRRAAEEWGARSLLIPFQPAADMALCERIAGEAGAGALRGEAAPADLVAVTASLDLVVAMRLHALIFAASQAVPAVGLSYDPKVAAFCKLAGLPCLELEEADAARVWERAAFAFRGNGSFREAYSATAERLKRAAMAHFEALDEVITGIAR